MEILLSACVALLTQLIKTYVYKLNLDEETQKNLILIIAFVLTYMAVLTYRSVNYGVSEAFDVQGLYSSFALSIAWYQVVYKRVIQPLFSSLFKK